MFDRDIDAAISQLVEQWNIAERRIKKAEFTTGNQVVFSAVQELRYAGRKLIDVHHLLQSDKWRTDETEKARILAFLADATEDCVKAKHDAIDAMMLFVSLWFERTERKLGLSGVTKYFPDYITITGRIGDIQQKIATSRGDRTILRDPIYDDIEVESYEGIISLYDKMKASEPRVQAEVAVERRRTRILVWGTVICVILALPALILAIIAFYRS
jgi:hypothetical protein